eukprot:1494259-Heterocapsa_arctica.AAC.1
MFGTFGTLFGTSLLSPLKSSQTTDHLTQIMNLRGPFRASNTRSTDLFGTALQTCSEHKSVRNTFGAFGTVFGANT